MCKWRISYGFNPDPIPASEHPEQATLEGLDVIAGVFDDGESSCYDDPGEMGDPDWEDFVNRLLPHAMTLVNETLPGALGGSWGASYAWDLNG